MNAQKLIFAALVSVILLGACAPTATSPQPYRPAVTPSVTNSTVAASPGAVLDAVLNVAQQVNLNVDLIDRIGGLVRFQTATLDAAQLDRYCAYPLVNTDGRPHDTFQGWSSRSVAAGGSVVTGTVDVTVLVSPVATGSNVSIRTTWTSVNSFEGSPCQGNGVFDDEAIAWIESVLANPDSKSPSNAKGF